MFSFFMRNKKTKVVPLRYTLKNNGRISPFEKIFEDDWIYKKNDENPTINQNPFLRKEDFCLIGNKNELFWVKITEIDKTEFIGQICDELNEPMFYDKGCLVRFFDYHILQTHISY